MFSRVPRASVLVVPALAASTLWADVIHVPGDATLQQAINMAHSGDEIIVAPGTYMANLTLESSDSFAIRSAEGPEVTIIDGSLSTDEDFASVIHCLGCQTTIEGFTITGGKGSVCRQFGAGMYIVDTLPQGDANPHVINCTFVDNQPMPCGAGGNPRGGGIWAPGGTFEGCVFEANDATEGGGAYVTRDVRFINCEFVDNTAFQGGAIWMNQAPVPPLVSGCTLQDNLAVEGGAIYSESRNATIVNCIFIGNSATSNQGFGGGAILNAGINSEMTIANCLFLNNVADRTYAGGGAIYNIASSDVRISNCTFVGNFATVGGALFNDDFSTPEIWNCIFRANANAQIFDALAVTTVAFSNVEGGWFGVGWNNIDSDPMFVGAASGDFQLSAGSPCIDAGHNWAVPIDEIDIDNDGNVAELIPVDLAGHPRFNADPVDFDTGCGVPVVVDMGAYEFQFNPVDEVLFADSDGNGAVDVDDLVTLILVWGPCEGPCCLSDFDLSGEVDVDDLVALILNWS